MQQELAETREAEKVKTTDLEARIKTVEDEMNILLNASESAQAAQKLLEDELAQSRANEQLLKDATDKLQADLL